MQKTDNRSTGGRFEQELSRRLADGGFWVHVMQQNASGQPADIVAIKGKFHTLIDCKVISDNNGFPFERIEENQMLAMKMFQRKCNDLCYFALKLPDGSMWMVALERLLTLQARNKKRITEFEIRTETWSLESWLKSSDTWAEDT